MAQEILSENVSASNIEYTGSELSPNIVVRDKQNHVLAEGTDYTLSIKDSNGKAVSKLTARGTYTAYITCKGNYKGSITKTFKVTVASLDMVNVTVNKKTFVYSGKVQTPSVTVKNDAGDVLVAGTDYKVTVPKSIKVGGYTLEVSGLGDYATQEPIEISYKIVPYRVSTLALGRASYGQFLVGFKPLSSSIATNYKIAYSTKSDFSSNVGYAYVSYKSGSTKLYKYITGLKAGTKYYVKVLAYKKTSVGTYSGYYSTAKSITTTKPSTVTTKSLTKAGACQFTLTFKQLSYSVATGYKIAYSTTSDFSSNVSYAYASYKKGATTLSKTVYGLKAGTKYYVKVLAYKKTSAGTYAGSYNAAKSITTSKVGTVKSFSVKSACKSASVTITQVSSKYATGYQILARKVSDANSAVSAYVTQKSGKTTITGKIKGLTNNVAYYVAVRAYYKTSAGIAYGSWTSYKSITPKHTADEDWEKVIDKKAGMVVDFGDGTSGVMIGRYLVGTEYTISYVDDFGELCVEEGYYDHEIYKLIDSEMYLSNRIQEIKDWYGEDKEITVTSKEGCYIASFDEYKYILWSERTSDEYHYECHCSSCGDTIKSKSYGGEEVDYKVPNKKILMFEGEPGYYGYHTFNLAGEEHTLEELEAAGYTFNKSEWVYNQSEIDQMNSYPEKMYPTE